MNLLEGSIAFALALAGFATICTVLIEILHRVLGMRADGMKKMLEGYFEDVIKPKLPDTKVEDLREDLMNKLLDNPLRGQYSGPKWLPERLDLRLRLLKLTSVSTEDFLRRLPDTDLFKQIKQHGPREAEALVKQLADKYDQYGAGATDYFKRRAQLLSILMGILLALFANIHAVQLFDAFIKNPDLAQRMEAQASNIRQTLESQQPSTTPAPAPAPKAAPGPEPKAGQPGATQGAAAQANSATKPIDYVEVKAELDKTIATLKSYQEMGLPIGWRYYPNCFGKDTKDSRCDNAIEKAAADKATQETHKKSDSETPPCLIVSLWETAKKDFFGVLLWLFTVVLTGILIGLGGPFWFDLAVRLSQVRQAFTGKPALKPVAGDEAVAVQSQVSPRQQSIKDVSELLQPK